MGLDVPEGSPTTEETARLIQRWRWRRLLWILGPLVVLIIVAGSTTWIRDGLSRPLTVHDQVGPADVIIVLGAGTRKHGDRLPSQAKQRVVEGLQLLDQGMAPRMILSGGPDKNTGFIEADEMALYAADQGVDATLLTEERESKDTYENAKFSLAIMKNSGWQAALVVTSPYHTWRACRIFRAQQANVRCIAAPWSLLPANSFYERLMDTRSVLREYGAIVYNWFRNNL